MRSASRITARLHRPDDRRRRHPARWPDRRPQREREGRAAQPIDVDGALLAGLVLGYLRTIRPTFGRIPTPALVLMNTLGLNVFIAIVGINAGRGFVAGVQQVGVSLFIWGAVATTVPLVFGILLGHYVFKFHPAILFGAVAGVRTTTAALGMLEDAAKSKVPGDRLWDAVRRRQHAAHHLRHGRRAVDEQVTGAMDAVTLASIRDAESVRDQERPREGRCQNCQGIASRLSERRARQPELGRHRSTVGVLPPGQFAITESQRTMNHPAGVGGMAKAPGIAARLTAWLAERAEARGRRSCEGRALGDPALRVRARRLRP